MKLSGLGLELDEELCRRHLEALVADARDRGNFVRIDMEDSSTTDATLGLYRELRARVATTSASSCRPACAGRRPTCRARERPALQGDLRRAARRSPSTTPTRSAASYLAALERCSTQGAYVGIATHDEQLIEAALRGSRRAGWRATRSSSRCSSACGRSAATSSCVPGTGCASTCPFGTHWYEYSVRRLQENPKIAGYVAADTLRRLRASALSKNR